MGVTEKMLLTSLKAQRNQLEAHAGAAGLDEQARALMQENLAHLQAQIEVLEGGGTAADLAAIHAPASWGAEAAVDVGVDDAAVPVVMGLGSGGIPDAAPASGRSWVRIAVIAGSVLIAVATILYLVFTGGFTDTGCDIWTSGEGWTHYEPGHRACNDG